MIKELGILPLLSGKINGITPKEPCGPTEQYNPGDILDGSDTSIYCKPEQVEQIVAKATELLLLEDRRNHW
jgi:hypothetical protein